MDNSTTHTSKNSKKYLKLLDLVPGEPLLLECNKIWSHYDEVIKNRKRCICDLVIENISKNHILQVIVFASGLDSLSLEITSNVTDVIVYEMDVSLMTLKEDLIRKVDGKLLHRIKCITSDLKRPEKILYNLKKRGWDCSKSTILVFEGISYYLSEKNLSDIVAIFKTKNKTNILLLEYLVPQSMIRPNTSQIPQQIFDLIQKNNIANLSQITRYNTIIINDCLADCSVAKKYTLKDMEKSRLGENPYFKTDDSGWIEICQIFI